MQNRLKAIYLLFQSKSSCNKPSILRATHASNRKKLIQVLRRRNRCIAPIDKSTPRRHTQFYVDFWWKAHLSKFFLFSFPNGIPWLKSIQKKLCTNEEGKRLITQFLYRHKTFFILFSFSSDPIPEKYCIVDANFLD